MLEIKNKIEFESTCWVAEVDATHFNSSEEERIKAVTDLASITRGKLGMEIQDGSLGNIFGYKIHKRRLDLYNKLLVESAGKPSVPFEFIPIRDEHFTGMKYGVIDNNYYLSNYREFKNNSLRPTTNAPSQVKGFKVIVGRVPMKVISHLRTHRAFSFLVESSRNKRYLNEVEFWYPSWWDLFTKNFFIDSDDLLLANITPLVNVKQVKPEEATMELSDRRLVHFAMCAYKQDTNAWDNLFAVRGDKTGTMNITGQTVDNIKKLIKYDLFSNEE